MSTNTSNGKLSNKDKQRLRAERAAAALEQKQRQERRRQLLTLFAVVVAVVAIVGGGFLVNSLRDHSTKTAASIPTAGSGDHGLTIGDASAPHDIVVYEDFLCPYCGEFEKAGHTQLADLADQGKVQVEYRPFVLLDRVGPYSERATGVWAMVLQNDGPEVAKAYHDLLFANQPSEQGPFPSTDELIDLAGQAGAEVDSLKASVDAGDGKVWARAATEAALGAGVTGTPTVLLDGKLFTDYRTPDDLAANLVKAVQ